MKTCKCGFSGEDELFSKVGNQCKSCRSARAKAYNKANKESIAAKRKVYRAANKKKLLAYGKTYREANKKKLSAYDKTYREANKGILAENSKSWRESNKESIAIREKVWREANKESIAAKKKVYNEVNPMQRFIRCSLYRILGNRKGGRKKYEELLGYTVAELRSHIEIQFTEGMNWENRSEWHIDHIKPISLFLKEGIECPATINALSNLQPLWAKDNLSKGASH